MTKRDDGSLAAPAAPTALPSVVRTLRAAATVAAVVVQLTAVAVLFGWAFHVESLKSVVPGFVYMNPISAVGLFVCGLALLLSRDERGTPATRRLACLLGAGAVLIGVTKLMAIFHGPDLGIDALLFRRGAVQNPMAPTTALCLILGGSSILTLDLHPRSRLQPSQVLALTCALIALLPAVGYAYSSSALKGGWYFPMALHTAVCFLILTCGLLFVRPLTGIMQVIVDSGSAGALARRLLPAAVVLPAIAGWLRLLAEKHGIFTPEIGLPLVAIVDTAIFTTLIWWNLGLLRKSDIRRYMIEEERDRIFTLSADLVSLGSLDGFFKRTNPAFETVLGYTEQEMLSHPWTYFVHPDDLEPTLAEGKKLAAGAITLHFENRYRCKDGTYKWLSWTSVPVVKDNVIYGIAHDMTGRKRAEQAMAEKNRLLEEVAAAERSARQALERAQAQLVQSEKLAGLGQMVAGVAHEINNPLSFVSNNLAVLQRDVGLLTRLLKMYQEATAGPAGSTVLLTEIRTMSERIDLPYTLTNLGQMIDRSRDGLRRIQQIVKDLRDFARLDQAELQDADINAGIESTLNIIQGYARKHQVTLNTSLKPLAPLPCHPAKVNQVVMNLLSNAIDASRPGDAVAIQTSPLDDGGVQIEVTDTGKGIEPAIRERIFDPFFTTKPVGQGTGLGLSISYGIVQDHGGQIEVDSEIGRGSTFRVRLPRRAGAGNV